MSDISVIEIQENQYNLKDGIARNALSDNSLTVINNPISINTLSSQNAKNVNINILPIQEGTGDPSPSNIRPISGVSSTSLKVCGTNLLQITAQTSTINNVQYTVNADGTITAKPTATLTQQSMFDLGTITFKAGKVYTLSGCPAGGSTGSSFVLFIRGNNSVEFAQKIDSGTGITFGVTQDVTTTITIIFYSGYSSTDEKIFRPMISLSSDFAFEKYKSPTDLTFSLGQTVFGGNLDVNSGKLTVTMENIPSYAGETLPGAWISDRDVYAPETTPTTGAQVVYEISTPYTIQLTGSQVELLKGLNNVISDANKIALTYRSGEVATLADVMELDKKIDASGTSGNIYSTNEHIVGTWIDEKNIYKRTIVLPSSVAVPANSWSVVADIDITSEDVIVKTEVYLSADKSVNTVFGRVSNGNFQIFSTISLTIDLVTIQYTKTTD